MKSWCVTIQKKAIEQCFHVVLFIMLYKVVLTTKFVEQYFHVVLFIMLYKVVVTFLSLSMKPQCVTIQMKAVQGGSNFKVCG